MGIYQIEVRNKTGIFDARAKGIRKDFEDIGIFSAKSISLSRLYILKGRLLEQDIKRISKELLSDAVTEEFICRTRAMEFKMRNKNGNSSISCSSFAGCRVVTVAYNPGVMDPVEESLLKAVKDLGINGLTQVKTASRYIIEGDVTDKELTAICNKLLFNKTIQHILDEKTAFVFDSPEYEFKLVKVFILDAEDKKLKQISKARQLFLNLPEMRKIKQYFKKLKRNPTDCELETLAQTWSEHCKHKTLRGKIEYREVTGNQRPVTRKIDNLLKETIMKVTKELNKPWCVSVFEDNSGIIRFDENYNICFKVETHNHPSALEPYGGANTGIGGVIRDSLGTGLCAKPVVNTDIFCFGFPDYPYEKLPRGIMHPKRIMKGVVSGVRDYGNKMGIPTSNGAVLFDERFVGNPLVYCGNAGLIPRGGSFKKVIPGDLIVLIGGRTGRDGIHGATFSSSRLTTESGKISSSAVQIGNPITEKKMVDTLLKAREEGLYHALTDCGGGGLSSAVGEMGEACGVRLHLERVPLKYRGLSYTEIWISEAQERMVLALPKNKLGRLLEIFREEDVEATLIGEFTSDRRLRLFYNGNLVCDLEMEFLHKGLPNITRKALWKKKQTVEPKFRPRRDLTDRLLKILSSWNVCSKEWIIRQYDHEVQGGSVIKPLVGMNDDGPSDAAVVRPRLDSKKGIILSCGINPRYGEIDPYWMAASCIDEALRQIISVGGTLKEVAILDNFCWGDTEKAEQLGSLVRCAFGCYDIAKGYAIPFISGKDSLNNEYRAGSKSVSIPGTLLISAVSVMEDVSKAITMDAKEAGSLIYVVGETFDELGGSEYYGLAGFLGNNVPKVDCKKGKRLMHALSKAIDKRLVLSCHDCSEGGIAVAAAEMAFAGGFGMEIFLKEIPYKVTRNQSTETRRQNDFILFSESNTRFIVEVDRKNQKKFERELQGIPSGLIGCVSGDKYFKVYGTDARRIVCVDIDTLKEAWQSPLRW